MSELSLLSVKGWKKAPLLSIMQMTAKKGLKMALSTPYDAAVIDIMLPRLDGMALIAQMRQKKCEKRR